MELWYTDEHTKDVRFSMKTVEQIASKKSAVQQIDILDTHAYGRVLVLDGNLMITETDEFIYRGEVFTDDDGNETAYFSEDRKKATARLRAYVAGDFYEGLMTAEGKIITTPLFKNINAIGIDTYLCEVSEDYHIVVNGKGEIVQ